MKASTPLLLLSLAANLALGAALVRRAASPPAAGSNRPASVQTAPSASLAPPLPPAAPSGAETWTRLNAAGDADFVARLRAEGFPPNLMFALVNLRLLEHHAAALGKFRPSADYAYWRKSFYEDPLSPEDRAARRALSRQISDERRQLLGADSDPARIYERTNRQRIYGRLPVEKTDQLTAINQDYAEITALLRDRAKGVMLPEDRDQWAALEREKRADLAKVLTPQELLEYDLRSSPSAVEVRQKLRHFDPTEEEYRALTTLQLAFDTTYGNRANLSGEQQQRRNEAAAELTAQIKALLPPERFAEYETKTDPAYMQIASVISQYHSPADATAVLSAQRDLARRFNSLRQNRDLSPDARNTQLDALSAEANSRMAAALGPEAFEMYKFNGGPINALLNRPTRKP